MSDVQPGGGVQDLWQGQPAEGGALSLDELRTRARWVERRIRRRNRREYVAAVVAVIGFGGGAWIAPTPLIRIGAGLLVATAVFIAYHIHRWGSARTMPADMALTSSLQFYRRELERQRDLLRGVWKWYLLPCVPGLVLFNVGVARIRPEGIARLGITAIVTLAVFVFLSELNRRAANKIQARLDALERDV